MRAPKGEAAFTPSLSIKPSDTRWRTPRRPSKRPGGCAGRRAVGQSSTQSPGAQELAIDQAKSMVREAAVRVLTDLMRIVGVESCTINSPVGAAAAGCAGASSFWRRQHRRPPPTAPRDPEAGRIRSAGLTIGEAGGLLTKAGFFVKQLNHEHRTECTPSLNGSISGHHGAGILRAYKDAQLPGCATSRSVEMMSVRMSVTVQGDIPGGCGHGRKRVFEAAFERFGRVDTLVNNVGMFMAKAVYDVYAG